MQKGKIRTATQNDAKEMLDIQRAVLAERDFLMTTLEEFDQTIEGQQSWIQAKMNHERETILVAEVNERIVGWIVFQSSPRKRLAHTGSFGMMVHKDFRDQGIGKALLQELLRWAEQNRFIEKVCLGVFSTNEHAIALYKKLGFIEEGRKVNEVKLSDEAYVDDVLMYKNVKKET